MAPDSSPGHARVADRSFRIAEDAIYSLAGLLLVVGALVLLGKAGYELVTEIGRSVEEAIKKTLDTLLLAFILVELLSAVRATMKERKLIAEPFLLVGIIASIKEIIVIGSEVSFTRRGAQFERAMIQLGVLGALVVALSLATLAVRRKEREPKE